MMRARLTSFQTRTKRAPPMCAFNKGAYRKKPNAQAAFLAFFQTRTKRATALCYAPPLGAGARQALHWQSPRPGPHCLAKPTPPTTDGRAMKPMDEKHPRWKKLKLARDERAEVAWTPPGHDHFIYSGCGAAVYRPGRAFDDDSRCLNCWHGGPQTDLGTTEGKPETTAEPTRRKRIGRR
jgi:hypothetical protein